MLWGGDCLRERIIATARLVSNTRQRENRDDILAVVVHMEYCH